MPTLGFFPGLSGHDTGLAYMREKEIVSDLFQTVLAWAYGLGGRAGVMHGGQLEEHPRVTWMGIHEHDAYCSLRRPASVMHVFVFLCILLHLCPQAIHARPGREGTPAKPQHICRGYFSSAVLCVSVTWVHSQSSAVLIRIPVEGFGSI